MRILKIEPGKLPQTKLIDNTLESMQAEVDGLIEVIPVGSGICIVCNDEGKLNGMQPNRWLGDDIICGPFFCVADDGKGGFKSLNYTQLKMAQKHFSVIDVFTGNEPQLEPRIEFVELEDDDE